MKWKKKKRKTQGKEKKISSNCKYLYKHDISPNGRKIKKKLKKMRGWWRNDSREISHTNWWKNRKSTYLQNGGRWMKWKKEKKKKTVDGEDWPFLW